LKLGLASSGLFFAGCGGGSDSPGTVNPSTVVPPLSDTPGALSRDKPSKRIIVISAGVAGLVAAYELDRAGHDLTIAYADHFSLTLDDFYPARIRFS
jgi:NADPH-dependent 2,4-dienoyl-CoA reductase/sulfur reductase-like enzyme